MVIDAPIILRYIAQRQGCIVALDLYRSLCGPVANYCEDAKNLSVLYKAGNLFTNLAPVSFGSSTLLHGVCTQAT